MRKYSMFKLSRAVISASAVALLAQGCSNTPPKSIGSLPDPEYEALEKISEHTVEESRKLFDNMDRLSSRLQQSSANAAIEPVAPRFDPLAAKNVDLALSGSTLSQTLNVLAEQADMSLIVDPQLLEDARTVDMYLRDISLRDAFDEVLRVYDVDGKIIGNTMRVGHYSEKVFSLGYLNSVSSLDLSSGGNVFGSNTAGGSNVLQGNIGMTGQGGADSNPYDEIEKAVQAVLGNQRGDGERRSGNERDESTYTLNRMTGTLYVKSRPSKMRAIENMLEHAKDMLGRQVYIEAQLIDVQLSDNFEFGVDWTVLRKYLAAGYNMSPGELGGVESTLPNPGSSLPARTVTVPSSMLGRGTGASMGAAYQNQDFSMVLSALRAFGNLKVLSNPNIQVRNGTPAMLSVGNSIRYVSSSSSTQTAPGGGASTTTSDVQTDSVFSGVMVGVMPYIRDDGRIELMVQPMQSEADPASLQLVEVSPNNRVSLPVINYKGLTTTLNISDGDIVLVGGLIDQRSANRNSGAPGLSDIPAFGHLFSNQSDMHESRELVVVMRVHVL